MAQLDERSDDSGNRARYLRSSRGSSLESRFPALVPAGPMYGDRDVSPDTSFDTKYTSSGSSDRTTLSRWRAPLLPFVISIGRHESVSSDSRRAALNDTSSLCLLVPPSEFSLSSGHEASVESTRSGQQVSLWGPGQATISLQGTSAAFLTSEEGLSSSSADRKKVSRTDSLGFQNFMGLVAMFKANGYKRLTEGEDPFPGRRITGSRNRVVHVLDCVQVSYDGTTYMGHFTDLSFSDDPTSPFIFKYSITFIVSGIKGDLVSGHICDGSNQKGGILIGRSAMPISLRVRTDIQALQIDEIDRSLTQVTDSQLKGMTVTERMSVMPPENKAKFDGFLAKLRELGHSYTINSTVRSAVEQGNLSKGGYLSRHCYGAAIDILVTTSTGAKLHNCLGFSMQGSKAYSKKESLAHIALWRSSGIPKIANSFGLEWGGDLYPSTNSWYGDTVHFQVKGNPAELQALFNKSNSTKGAPSTKTKAEEAE